MLCTWSQCSGCESLVRAGDASAARQGVGRFVGDEVTMARLRQLALTAGAEASPQRCDDHALAERIAAGIAAGSMRVCGPAKVLPLYGLATPPAASSAPAPPAPSPSPQPRAAPVAAPPTVETTFGSDLDVAAMVAVLRAAAQDGVPFCEECARVAAARHAASSTEGQPATQALGASGTSPMIGAAPSEAENASPLPAVVDTTHWIEIQFTGEGGQAVADIACTVVTPDMRVRNVVTDSNGWLRIDSIVAGTCQISFPALEESEWQPA